MVETLCSAIDALHSADRGLHFTDTTSPGSSSRRFCDFRQLRNDVERFSRKLTALNCQRSEPVLIVFAKQAEFIRAFLAVIRAGLVAVPVYPPALLGDRANYVAHIERMVRITRSRYVLTSHDLAKSLRPCITDAKVVTDSEIDSEPGTGNLPTVSGSDAALIQFTSGSTGSPKGVELTHDNLVSNALGIQQALAIDPARDRGLSWLPLHHDMGLIGFLIVPILVQASTWYMPSMEFARRPQRWLELMHESKATISYAPNFGYDLVTRRVRDADLALWDLSDWRVAGCGGEAVVPEVLAAFARRLKPAGFNACAFAPSYGLAEATVAVSISPLQRGVVSHRLVKSQADPSAGVSTARSISSSLIVSSGKPIANTQVRLTSSDASLANGCTGEIQVRGPGVARRFLNESGYSLATCEDGWLSTGDIGVYQEGELHICGRLKETIVLNGRNVFAHDVEECVLSMTGVQRGRVVAFGRPGAGSEQLVVVVETRDAQNTAPLRRQLRSLIRTQLGLNVADVVCVRKGVISRTTSGKLQRNALKRRYLSGNLQSVDVSAAC